MTSQSEFSLQFEQAAARRGDNLLFSGLSFDLRPSQIVWIHGENGSGKTTILNLAAGLTPPDEGKVDWYIGSEPVDASDLVAYQGHQDAVKNDLRVKEDIEFWLDIYGTPLSPAEVLALVRLQDRNSVFIRNLSAGQRRRLSLARLIISRKPIWIMDEPTASMDEAGRDLIMDLIKTHAHAGGAILLASHSRAVKLGVSTRLISLERT